MIFSVTVLDEIGVNCGVRWPTGTYGVASVGSVGRSLWDAVGYPPSFCIKSNTLLIGMYMLS
jgi:hypothetical protein